MTRDLIVAAALLLSIACADSTPVVSPPDTDPASGGDAANNLGAPDASMQSADMGTLSASDMARDGSPATPDGAVPPNSDPDPQCTDRLADSGAVVGPQGLMIQVPSVDDTCELERALDHVCQHHPEIADLVLTSVETWENGEVRTELKSDVLAAIAPYFDCFGNVFVGTVSEILLDDPYGPATINDPDERWRWILAAREVADLIAPWMEANHGGTWHWYISYEANLNAFTDTTYRNAYVAMLQQHITDVSAMNDGVLSWSPTFWTNPDALTTTARADLVSALTNTFDRVPVDWVLIQDHLGVQPSWTCDDALAYYDIVREAGPDLDSVQLNVEYFTTGPGGIETGEPDDLAARVACYRDAGASLGASFEYRYWYETHGH